MKGIILLSVLLAVTVAVSSKKVSYNGYRLVRLFPDSSEKFETLFELESTNLDFDIWNVNPSVHMDVLLPPITYNKYVQIFNANGIPFQILEANIQNKIDEQEQSMLKSRNGDASPKNIIFKYARYSEIISFISSTVANNPDIASSYSAGTTYQNRDLRVIVLKTASSNRAIWIDCGIHAREWVSPATCVYTINALVEGYRNNDPKIAGLLSKYEFHILPSMNPDGYEYTHTTTRLWRKNRSPNAGSSCIGTDLNRNFDYRWLTGGSSTDKCSEVYAGSKANSELETNAVINAINQKLGSWDAFVSVHSYGLWWLTPYGHSTSNAERPPDYNDLVAKGKIAADAIRAYNGTVFTVGSSAQLLYVNTGSSIDYMYAKAGIKYSYVLELRPGQTGQDAIYGFTLPENRMPLVATETFLGLVAFFQAI